MKLNIEVDIEVDIEIVDKFLDNKYTIARIYYPYEGNKIQIIKNLNVINLSESIFHEIGHLIDWYISNNNQSENVEIRKNNADTIADNLRYKTNSDNTFL